MSPSGRNLHTVSFHYIAVAIPERNLYSDTASGKLDDRPGLEACLKALRDGDTLITRRNAISLFVGLDAPLVACRVKTGKWRMSTDASSSARA